jgi:hypothetical protein
MSHAADLRGARRRRIVHIRRTVLAISLAMFIALFAGLYVQMAAGRDPVLGSSVAATSTKTSQSTTSSSSASGDASTGTSSDDGTGSSAPAAVTTSQS